MRKVVINSDIDGNFGLSDEACDFLNVEFPGHKYLASSMRDDPDLVECVESIGSRGASAYFSCLKVVEIPADIDWTLYRIRGHEIVAEKGKVWF